MSQAIEPPTFEEAQDPVIHYDQGISVAYDGRRWLLVSDVNQDTQRIITEDQARFLINLWAKWNRELEAFREPRPARRYSPGWKYPTCGEATFQSPAL